MTPNIGIDRKHRSTVKKHLKKMIGGTYVLAVKTHGFHWNVTGPNFSQLHALFGDQYEALFEAADDLSERVRALGHAAPAGMAELLDLSPIAETSGAETPKAMLQEVLDGHEALSRFARTVQAAAQSAGDEVTNDLMVERMAAHDKAAWMLRALLS